MSCRSAAVVTFAWFLAISPVASGNLFAQAGKGPKAKTSTTDPKRPKPDRSGTSPKRASRGPAGVRGMFIEAQKLYNAGKFQEALVGYDAILRKYPGHEPSTIQYAKTLYRLDRFLDSYAMFARINPQYLDPETSYEYGWSFYTSKQYEGALLAFKRVPAGHSLYDLANYYGALCALKLKRYAEAEELLDKAVVLPDKLAKDRALYQKHAQSLRLMQDKEELAKERQSEKKRIEGAATPPPGAKPGSPGGPVTPPADPGKYEHEGFEGVDRLAKVGKFVIDQTADLHSYAQVTSHTDLATFNFWHGPLIPLPFFDPQNPKRRAAAGLQLGLGAEERTVIGQEQRRIIVEDNSDIARLLTTEQAKSTAQTGTVSILPWIEIPLPGSMWTTLAGDVEFYYPEFQRGGRSGSREGRLAVGLKLPTYVVTAKLVYTDFVDAQTKPVSALTNGHLALTYTLPQKLTLVGQAGYKRWDYFAKSLDESTVVTYLGPDSVTYMTAEAKQGMPLGFSLQAMGGFDAQANAIYSGMPTYGVIAADGQALTGRLRLVASPFSWLNLKATQLYTKTTWIVDNPEARETFEKNVPSVLSELSFGGEVLFNF